MEENPWTPIVGVWGRGRRRVFDDAYLLLLWGGIAFHGAATALVLAVPEVMAHLAESVGFLSYVILILVVFLAPSAGSAVRGKIDRSPFLDESRLTLLRTADYTAPLWRRCLRLSKLAALFFFTFFLTMTCFLFSDAGPTSSGYLEGNMLFVFSSALLEGIEGWKAEPFPPYWLLIPLSLVTSFAFGYATFLRMSLLAMLRQGRGMNRLHGAAMTLLIVVATPVLLHLRIVLAGVFGLHFFEDPRHMGDLLLYMLVGLTFMELVWANFARLAALGIVRPLLERSMARQLDREE